MTALVTGASSGIGLQYATVLARDYGCDVLLVSNQEQELLQTAENLRLGYGVQAWSFCCDLAEAGAAQRVYDRAAELGLTVDVLINNAGIFFFDAFNRVPPAKIETMVMLHMVTMTQLCRLFGADMCARVQGYILNMSSLCNWMDFPGIQTYCSTKAFIYHFSRSLWFEYRLQGVGVTVVTPGAVDTGLYGLAPNLRRLAVRLGISIPPEKLARKALKRMFARKKSCMPGLINHLAKPIFRHFPDTLVFAVMKRLKMFRSDSGYSPNEKPRVQ